MQQITRLIVLMTYAVYVTAKLRHKKTNDGSEMFPKFYRDMAKSKEDRTDLVIQYDGYPVEIHSVTTSDGYILKSLRIPHGKKHLIASKEPVLFAHGITCTAATFLLVSPERALPYLLADRGYDVWLPVFRGNPMSSGHVKYTQKDSEYWNFSLDEPGLYDLPAIIDMVLNVTGKKKLSIICLSFGCRYTYITLTNVTGYNQKVHKVANLAPAVFVGASKLFAWTTLPKFLGLINAAIYFQPSLLNRVVPFVENSGRMGSWPCRSRRGKMCVTWVTSSMGFEPSVANHTTYFKHFALTKDKTSIKTWAQVPQLTRSKKFIPFDYGRVKNQEVYGTKTPPEFDLTKVRVPSIVVYSYGDEAIPPQDMKKFYSLIPSKYRKQFVAVRDRKFSHADFMMHDKVKELVYDYVIHFLKHDEKGGRKTKKDGAPKEKKRSRASGSGLA